MHYDNRLMLTYVVFLLEMQLIPVDTYLLTRKKSTNGMENRGPMDYLPYLSEPNNHCIQMKASVHLS